MVERYRSGWWLAIKYHGEGWTQREIADECGVSPRCIREYMNEFDIETRAVEGENHGLFGQERDEEVKEAISDALRGREFDDEARQRMAAAHTGREIPEQVRERIADSLTGREKPPETRAKMSQSRRGVDNHAWRGGHVYRYGPGWTAAREAARDRDEVCRQCGHDGSERTLDVHHIVPVRHFRDAEDASLEAAHDLSNLVLLCRACHAAAEHGRIGFESGIADPLSETGRQ